MSTISYDSALTNLESVISSNRNIAGIGGNSTIVPLQSASETYGYFWTRSIINAFVASLWQCHRVVSCKPKAMGNAWGKLVVANGDPKLIDKANKFFNGLRRKYVQGQILANQHGGATILRFVDDGRSSSESIDLNNINKVRYSRVFDRWECYPDPFSYKVNPTNPEYYLISIDPSETTNVLSGNIYKDYYLPSEKSYMRIHRDRVIRFDGEFLDADSLKWNQGWHASTLIRFLPPLLRYIEAVGYVGGAMKSFEVVLFLVDGLFKMLSTPKGKSQIKLRSAINQEGLNSLTGMVADREREDVKVVSRNFSNVDKVIHELRQEMKGASGLDDIELFNEHPKGFQSTGQSQRLEKAKETKQLCIYHWDELLNGNITEDKIGDVDIYLNSKESMFNNLPEDYSWEWNEDIAITPEEKAKIYYIYSTGDKNYRNSGVITEIDTRSRFEGNKFNENIILDNNSFNEYMENKKQENEENVRDIVDDLNDSNNTNSVLSSDAVEKLIIDPLDNQLLEESEYEQLLREVETEGE